MTNKPLDIAGFLRLVIEALNAARVEYLIGGAIENGRGENRAQLKTLTWWLESPSRLSISFPKSWKSETCSFRRISS